MGKKCPRQDPNSGGFSDIFEIDCPACGESVEFFKNEPQSKCPKCGQMVANPRIDTDDS